MCAETLTVFLVFFVQRAPSAGAADTFRWFFWKNHHKSHHDIQNWWTAGHNPTILPLSGTRPRFLPLPSGLTVAQRSFSSSGGASGVTRPAGETHWPRLTPTPTDVEKHRLDFSRIRTSSVSKGKSSRQNVTSVIIRSVMWRSSLEHNKTICSRTVFHTRVNWDCFSKW